MVNLDITFINDLQRQAYFATERNQEICGGFGSGKTYLFCEKLLTLLTSFNQYRVLIGRQEYKTLKATTMKTFFKVCPPELYQFPLGRWNEQDGYLRLINGSEVLFVHLDDVDEDYLRGLEINSAFLDQHEEISETMSDILSIRCGRWDMARPSDSLLQANPNWPMKFMCLSCKDGFFLPPSKIDPLCEKCGKPLQKTTRFYSPTYFLGACNPESESHYLYRYYHPESLEKKPENYYLELPSTENPALDPETIKVMLSKDPSWVQRFVYGKWGISESTVHRLLPDSILEPTYEWLQAFLKKSTLVRVLDHGDSSPTCCIWFAASQGIFLAYREYYQPGKLISYHRESIAALSGDENYSFDLADPAIFKKQSQKYGGFWCVADEYEDSQIDAPAIHFLPADNDEMGTRNRINELLSLDKNAIHPLTGNKLAPRFYFLKKSPNYPDSFGVLNLITEIKHQQRLKLGEINGKPIYSDERKPGIPDHAYDPYRYYVAAHSSFPVANARSAPENSFAGIRARMKLMKVARKNYGLSVPLA